MRSTMIASIFTASVLLAAADLYTGPVAAAAPVLVAQKAQAEIAAAEQIVASATQQQQMLTGQTGIAMTMQQQQQQQAQQQMLTGQTGIAMAMQQQQAQQQQAQQQQMLTGQTGIAMAMQQQQQQQAHQAVHQQQAISASDAAITAASSAQQSSSAAAHLAAVSAMNAMASTTSSSSQWDTSLGSTWGTNIPAQVWTQYMYPWSSSTDQANLASWGQFASSAWNLAGQQGANWDSWFSSNFNNGWMGDWGIHSNMLGNGDLLSRYMNGNGHLSGNNMGAFGNAGMGATGNLGSTAGTLESLLEHESMLGGNMNGAGALLGNAGMFGGATSPFGLTSTHFPSWVESSAMSTWQLWNALLNSQWTSRYFGNGAGAGLGQVPSFGAPQTSIGAANAALSAVEQLASAAALSGGFAQSTPATYVVDNANGNGYYAGSGYASGSGNAYWSGNGNGYSGNGYWSGNGNGNGNGYWADNGNSGYWSGNGNGYSGSGYYGNGNGYSGNGNGYSGNGNGYSGNGYYGNGYSGSGYYGSGNGYSGNGNGYSGSGYYGNGNGYSGNGYWNQNYGSGYSGSGNGYWGNNGYGSGYGNGYSGYGGNGYGYNGYGSGYSGTGQSTCVQTQVGQTNATLTCPTGMVISSITAAAWGQTPGQCPSPNVNGYCTMNVTQTIAKSCLNTNTCNVGATTMVLGSPTNNGQQCVTVSGGGMFVQPGQAIGSNTNPDTLTVAYTCAVAGATPFGMAGGLTGTAGNMLGTGSLSFMPSPADTAAPSAVIVTVIVAAIALAAL
ncbi:Galactose binding lectin [Plasmodiophora brassicae]